MTDRSSDTVHQDKKVAELEKQNADLSRKLRGRVFIISSLVAVLITYADHKFCFTSDQMHVT